MLMVKQNITRLCVYLLSFVNLKLINLSLEKDTEQLNLGPQSAIQGLGLWTQFTVGTNYLCAVSLEATIHPAWKPLSCTKHMECVMRCRSM